MTLRRLATALSAVALLSVAACGGGDGSGGASGGGGESSYDLADWSSVERAAKGSTVDWYMYGGDEKLNGYVNGYVKTEAAKLGVTVNQVRINDTVEAVNKVLGEKQAGRKKGSVDLIWINGENFATGKQADLWYCGWPSQLPSADFVDADDPAIANDFGLPVDDCEAAWNRGQSVVVYDSAKVSAADVASREAFLGWVEDNPGRFTYPAPPDFTGSMVVRTFFYGAAGGYQKLQGEFDQAVYDEVAPKAWATLNGLEKSLYRQGSTYPQGQPDVTKLYANGEIDAFLTYDAGAIAAEVAKGAYPKTTRSAVFEEGTIGNVNFVAIPDSSPDKAGALVVANLLQSPAAQYEKQVRGPGYFPAIDTSKTGEFQAKFEAIEVPESQLPFAEQIENGNPELQAEWLTRIEKDWKANVLQK